MSKKVTIISLIFLCILSLFFTKAEASNIQIGEKTNIVRDHCCDDLLQFRPETGNYPAFKDVQKVYYTDSTGTNYPAFCIEPGKGEDKKCDNYCNVCKWCPYYQKKTLSNN